MKKWIWILIVLALLAYVFFKMFSSPISRSVAMREALQKSDEVLIFEGLPHQTHESEQLEHEKKRQDIIKLGGFPFYAPAVIAPDKIANELKSLLVDETSYTSYTEGKKCGGFHPDFALRWKRKKHTYWLLICYGCGEVIFTDGVKEIKYDLNPPVKEQVQKLLMPFKNKRPAPAQ